MSDTPDTREAWVVMVNTDLTEGRGRQYVKHVCETEATALRLARGADVQGSNGTVTRTELVRREAAWFGPIHLIEPSADDRAVQEALDKRQRAFEKALAAGLTEDDIADLRRRALP